MPQVTVYIRNEDIEKWRAIEQKAEFIHDALNSVVKDTKDYSLCKHDQIKGFCRKGCR
jgi:hypothetical protein